MRILLAHNEQSSFGGASDVLAFERSLLEADGHHVATFSLPSADDLNLGPVRSGAKAIWNLEAAREARKLMETFRPDVFHVHTPFPLLSPAVFRMAARHGVPSVTTLHSYRYSCIVGTCLRGGEPCEDCIGKRVKTPGLIHKCYHDSYLASGALTATLALHKAIGTFSNSIARYIALTPFSKRLLMRDGVSDHRIVVKANATPDPGAAAAGSSGGSRYVAFAGRLVKEKGIETLLEAWRLLGPSDLTLRIAGDGPLRGLVEAHQGGDRSIEFLGYLSEPNVTDLLRGAEAVIVPSEWYEGQPLVTIRSLSVGTPVIVSDLENMSEDVLQDGAGAAFRTRDPESLAQVVRSLSVSPHAWLRRGEAARAAYLARHTPEATVLKLNQIYRDVIREGTGNA